MSFSEWVMMKIDFFKYLKILFLHYVKISYSDKAMVQSKNFLNYLYIFSLLLRIVILLDEIIKRQNKFYPFVKKIRSNDLNLLVDTFELVFKNCSNSEDSHIYLVEQFGDEMLF